MNPQKLTFTQKLALVALTLVLLYLTLSFFPAPKQHDFAMGRVGMGAMHAGVVGEINHSKFDPGLFLTEFNYNNHAPEERAKYYKETPLADGTKLREYWITAKDEEIEIAPGVFYPAWTYNGQVPGPTIKATEGDSIIIYFTNMGSHPHTMHFHGFHPSGMDGTETQQFVMPGETFTYEFKADPVGTHLYHCHSTPLKKHIEKGLYGAYIVEPKEGREKADKEWFMVLNGFDTNFDGENEIYAVNTEAFAYMKHPIKAKVGELVRIHVINVAENDPINSIHIHANFFWEYPTGTGNATEYTDIIELGQGERSMLEIRFKYPGRYMFHAHQTEFSEKGWTGFIEVEE